MKKSMYVVGLFAAFGLVGTGLTGCGSDFRSYDEVENAIDHPSADVTGQTVKATITANHEQASDSVAAGTSHASFVRAFTGSTLPLYVPARVARYLPAQLPFATAPAVGAGLGCTDFGPLSQGSVSINLSEASHGETTGTLTIEISGDSICNAETVITFDQVCSTLDDTCVDGAVGFKADLVSEFPLSGKVVSSGRLTFTSGNNTATLEWGMRITYDEASATGTFEFTAFIDVNGDTQNLVIAAEEVQGTGTVSVRGKNGEFSCTYENEGDSGSCTGTPGTVSWQ
jgi:hypothetical protein